MEDPRELPAIETLTEYLVTGAHEKTFAALKRYQSAPVEERKEAIQALGSRATEQPAVFTPVLVELVPFLTDQERSIRLTTAKLFVAVAEAEPEAATAVVPALADRLADENEFYYVRGRSAEALGYVALREPDAVASPKILAELRVGLSFDEPEVTEKLAKALEYVALGRPQRIKHHISTLAEHLGDDNELVRYHLCTAITVVGCEFPNAIAEVKDALRGLLDDENPYVRGRAAEALGLLAQSDDGDRPVREAELAALAADEESFVSDRVEFASRVFSDRAEEAELPDEVGSVEGIRNTTDGVAEEVSMPDDGSRCPECGRALPHHEPPLCPRCGSPH